MQIIATIQVFEQVGQDDYKNVAYSKEYTGTAPVQFIINDMKEFVKKDIIDGNGEISNEKVFSKLILSVKQ